MTALIYAVYALLAASLAYAVYGLAVGSKFAPKAGMIYFLTLGGIAAMLPPDEKLKLGIDLSGGTILVYQVKGGTAGSNFNMDDLVGALKRRVNASGVRDIPIRKVGSNRVEIIMAKASDDDVAELKRRLTDVGSLEFRILANRKHDSAAIDRALQPGGFNKPPARYKWARLGEVVTGKPTDSSARVITDSARNWVPDKYVKADWAPSDRNAANETHLILTGKDSSGREVTRSLAIVSNTANQIRIGQDHGLKSITSYTINFNPSGIVGGDDAIVREEPRGGGVTEKYILVNIDRHNVTGEYLQHVSQTTDERVQPAVRFVFNSQGGRKFGRLTGEHQPEEQGAFMYRLAILLDDLVMTAPVIKSEIRDEGVIEGIPPKDIEHQIVVLRSGSLPASVDPTPLLEEKVGPTLGRDTITKGLFAIGISMIVVPIFMLAYYRFAGFVAVVALVLNMLLLVGSMAVIDATFTLPGLAGLALTIGMAVDANVLIFERMREEKERGASLAQQIRNGYDRAWTTILDSNVTTILSGIVLYAVGTEEVKGFALTLIIGLVWNLFTAVYVSRVMFDYFFQAGWLKKLSMMKIMDKTHIDFVGPRRYFMIGSAVVILAGLVYFVSQGQQNYNIDFTGGTLVTIQLNGQAPEVKDLSPSERSSFVREKASSVLPDATIESLNVGEEAQGLRYNIRTTEENAKEVQDEVKSAFQSTLARIEMTVGEPKPIPAAAKPAEGEAKAKISDASRFEGGRQYDLRFNRAVEPSKVRTALTNILRGAKVSTPEARFEVDRTTADATLPPDAPTDHLVLRTDLDAKDTQAYLKTLGASLRDDPTFLFDRLENFGGAVAGETRTLAMIAIVASWLIMIAYLWLRFKSVTYGFAAVLALVHDVLFTLGAVSISPYKIDLPMVAAFLTLIGFSVNDTIVIFDRIREIKGKTPGLTPQMVNEAVNQTLSRTVLTSLTAWLVVVILFLFGGEGLRGFSFCLVVGFLSGTYSTIYIASPVLIDWIGRQKGGPSAKEAKPLVASR